MSESLEALSETAPKNGGLIGPKADFWLIGGVSCVVCAILDIFGRRFADLFASYSFINFFLFSKFFAVVLVYPHFLSTFRIAYGRGMSYIREQWFALIGVPVLGIAFFVFAYSRFDLASPSVFDGKALFVFSVVVLVASAGWHHSQQAYGCFRIFGRLSNYEMEKWELAHLRRLFALLWLDGLINTQIFNPFENRFSSIQFPYLHLPLWIGISCTVVTWIYILWIAHRIFYRKWRAEGHWPPATSLVAIASLIMWWTLPFYKAQYFLLFSIIFHPLQYVPFGVRYESSKVSSRLSYRLWAMKIGAMMALATLIAAGIPMFFDLSLNTEKMGEGAFFLLAAGVIINIHHFFVDAKIWKTSHPDVRKLLLSGARESGG